MTFILSEDARLRMTEGGAWQSALPAPLRDLDSVGMMIPMSPIPRRGRTVTRVGTGAGPNRGDGDTRHYAQIGMNPLSV